MLKKSLILLLFTILTFGISGCSQTADTESPVISGIRDVTLYIEEDEVLFDFEDGITAFDNVDGNITSELHIDTSDVNLNIPGVYTVTYSVFDQANNHTTKSITITVLDIQSPTIIGFINRNYIIGNPIPNLLDGVTALDNVDDDLTENIILDASAVDFTKEGIYIATYVVEDSSGNSSARYSSTIDVEFDPVISDNLPPVISGHTNMTYVIGISATPDFADGVIAQDEIDGYVPVTINSSQVNLDVPGT